MRTLIPASLLAAMVLAGCASNPVFPLARPGQAQQADIIVFRESAFAAGGVTATVGLDGKAFANLGNDDRVQAFVPAGDHELHVQARSAEPTRLRVSLAAGSSTCFRTSASPGTYAKAAVPIMLIATGYHFYLDQVACPSDSELARYKDVPVAYRP